VNAGRKKFSIAGGDFLLRNAPKKIFSYRIIPIDEKGKNSVLRL